MTEDHEPATRITLGATVMLEASLMSDGTYSLFATVNDDAGGTHIAKLPASTTQAELRAIATAMEDTIETLIRAHIADVRLRLNNPGMAKLVDLLRP
ncbi:MAG: hypothetical protein BWY85_00025 [Firmicutes bacterium ADurb.Bin506]|nr:MAG: hypothetical protein BWY85_00025 [Firmicutes bacterium ADurb.Bin506]